MRVRSFATNADARSVCGRDHIFPFLKANPSYSQSHKHSDRQVEQGGFRIEGKRKKRETEERDTEERETEKWKHIQ